MSYLERNKAITAELARVPLEKGIVVGKSSSTSFVSVGSYESEHLGRTLYLGVKFPIHSGMSTLLEDRFVFQLGVINAIATQVPDLEPSLPAFLSLLRGKDGEPKGIITEDVTHARKKTLENSGFVPDDVRDLFVDGSIEEDHFVGMAINVYHPVVYPDFPAGEVPDDLPRPERENKLVDFYPLIIPDFREMHRQRFNEAAIEKDLALHTLIADIA